ncbi:hypothetical protein KUCAC02_023800 [Chaenocephalus aceratus]|uniref:Uncharacterized protein n=1 Tax=Chaenocephalus aceratus TaxID=36190 RepID=A0ACB9WG88_CHAAC|nr:hypothetical protein KUCAC02_023800 [Chaenocephalus aceratus]
MAWFLYLGVFLVVGLSAQSASPHPPHVLFKELQQKYGQTYSLMLGSHCVIIVNQHTHAKEVLLKKGKIFAGRPRTLTTDILTRGGRDIAFGDYSAAWRFHRKIVHGALCMFGEGSASIEKTSEYTGLLWSHDMAADSFTEESKGTFSPCPGRVSVLRPVGGSSCWAGSESVPELTRAVTNVVLLAVLQLLLQPRRRGVRGHAALQSGHCGHGGQGQPGGHLPLVTDFSKCRPASSEAVCLHQRQTSTEEMMNTRRTTVTSAAGPAGRAPEGQTQLPTTTTTQQRSAQSLWASVRTTSS